MSLKHTSYTDADGRKKMVLLPEGISEDEAEKGVPVGPPSLVELGLPQDIEVRLHNELFNRGILTPKDALKGRAEIMGALQSALKVDVGSVVELYVGKDFKVARTERKEEPKPQPRLSNNQRRRRRSN